MKLEEMRYFVEAVNAGSINQAAKTLYVSQPALSRVLAALEKELKFPLLERSKQGIRPTREGMEVYHGCVRILQLYNDTVLQWQALGYRFSNKPIVIQIIALPIICNSIMSHFFADIAEKYPHIQLQLYERQLPDVLEATASHPHSIGFSHYNEKSRAEIESFAKEHQMQIIPLFHDEYKFFASSAHPLIGHKICVKDLKNYTIARYSCSEHADQTQFVHSGLADIAEKFGQELCLSNLHTMLETAAASQTITLTADRMTQDNIYRKSGRLLPLKLTDFQLSMTYFLLVSIHANTEEKIIAELLRSHYLTFDSPP